MSDEINVSVVEEAPISVQLVENQPIVVELVDQGPQGIQGIPGPNEVTTDTDSDITGILKGAAGKVAQAVAGTDYSAPGHTHAGVDITSAVASANDADTLDGEHASAFADAAHQHGGGDITSAVANANDADTVDGEHAAAFAASGHNHDLTYAPIAKGVTNGDTHDHSGGDGAQIDHGGLGGLGDDDHSQYHNDTRGDARYPIAIVDTKANILAMTCIGRRLAFATDTYEFFFDNGSAWYLMPFALIAEPAAPDMGAEQGSSRIGYGTDYISDKDIVNCLLLGNARSEEGAFRTASGVFQIYLNGVWNDVVINFRFREHSAGAYELEHMPIGYTEWYEVMSGNSNSLGLNGYPLIQQYTASMGPYPVPLEIDGGAF